MLIERGEKASTGARTAVSCGRDPSAEVEENVCNLLTGRRSHGSAVQLNRQTLRAE
jgi:hypothetical protein